MILTIPTMYLCYKLGLSKDNSENILISLESGFGVSLVTALCQYFVTKKKLKNEIYLLYLSYYRQYYYSTKYSFLGHYDYKLINKELVEITPKLNAAVDEYNSFCGKYDKFYKLIHEDLEESHDFNMNDVKNIKKKHNNYQYIDKVFGYYANEFTRILLSINRERFKKDEKAMKQVYDKLNYNK